MYAIIPENIKRLRTNAFIDSSTLTNVYLPKSLEYIGNNCFSGCYSLQEFTCPENLQSIQKNSFSKCENLKIFNTNNNLQTIKASIHADINRLKLRKSAWNNGLKQYMHDFIDYDMILFDKLVKISDIVEFCEIDTPIFDARFLAFVISSSSLEQVVSLF